MMRAAFERRGTTMHRHALRHRRRDVHASRRARSTASRTCRACSAASSTAPSQARRSSSPISSSRSRRWRSCQARRSAPPATRGSRSRSATTISSRASAASPSSPPADHAKKPTADTRDARHARATPVPVVAAKQIEISERRSPNLRVTVGHPVLCRRDHAPMMVNVPVRPEVRPVAVMVQVLPALRGPHCQISLSEPEPSAVAVCGPPTSTSGDDETLICSPASTPCSVANRVVADHQHRNGFSETENVSSAASGVDARGGSVSSVDELDEHAPRLVATTMTATTACIGGGAICKSRLEPSVPQTAGPNWAGLDLSHESASSYGATAGISRVFKTGSIRSATASTVPGPSVPTTSKWFLPPYSTSARYRRRWEMCAKAPNGNPHSGNPKKLTHGRSGSRRGHR